MAIIIRKKASVEVQAPEPLVEPRTPQPEPRKATERTPFDKLPIANSAQQMFDNPGQYRAPPPKDCTFCGHTYAFPCNGESDKCMNAKFVRGETV